MCNNKHSILTLGLLIFLVFCNKPTLNSYVCSIYYYIPMEFIPAFKWTPVNQIPCDYWIIYTFTMTILFIEYCDLKHINVLYSCPCKFTPKQ